MKKLTEAIDSYVRDIDRLQTNFSDTCQITKDQTTAEIGELREQFAHEICHPTTARVVECAYAHLLHKGMVPSTTEEAFFIESILAHEEAGSPNITWFDQDMLGDGTLN